MSAIYDPLTELVALASIENCRFCGCTEQQPCAIPIALGPDGKERLARKNEEVLEIIPCSWYLEECCNAPACVERLIAECRGAAAPPRVLLFDGQGRTIPLSPGACTPMDLAADDRDFALIGRELGLHANEVTREAILERIRRLRKVGA